MNVGGLFIAVAGIFIAVMAAAGRWQNVWTAITTPASSWAPIGVGTSTTGTTSSDPGSVTTNPGDTLNGLPPFQLQQNTLPTTDPTVGGEVFGN